jgi:hypothetical protein
MDEHPSRNLISVMKKTWMIVQPARIYEFEEHEADWCIETRPTYILLACVSRHFSVPRIGCYVPYSSALLSVIRFCIGASLK